ncbi:MAG: ATP-binding protein [Alphaproteobacteria bacterium]|nr:ATP-binding protein [Alphaproteobacteria bacterium]
MPARTFRLGSSVDDLSALAAFVEAFCGEQSIPDRASFHLGVVLEEVASNIVLHGFADGEAHEATVTLSREGDSVRIDVVDDGPAFDPLSTAAPDTTSALIDREVGGLGVEMMRKMTDSQTYRREDGRNRLTLVKRL